MNFPYKYDPSDIGLVIACLVIIVIGVIQIIRKRHLISYKQGLTLAFIGLLLFLIGIVGNSLASGNWELDFIIALLLLMSLKYKGFWGFEEFFQLLIYFGYMFLSFGITTLIVVRENKEKRNKE